MNLERGFRRVAAVVSGAIILGGFAFTWFLAPDIPPADPPARAAFAIARLKLRFPAHANLPDGQLAAIIVARYPQHAGLFGAIATQPPPRIGTLRPPTSRLTGEQMLDETMRRDIESEQPRLAQALDDIAEQVYAWWRFWAIGFAISIGVASLPWGVFYVTRWVVRGFAT